MPDLENSNATPSVYGEIYSSISEVILLAKNRLIHSVNLLMTVTYWEIGRKIVEFQQEGTKRAKYGSNIISNLALDLTKQFGRGFSTDNLELMRLFYLTYPISQISESLTRKLDRSVLLEKTEPLIRIFSTENLIKIFPLSWTHYVQLIRRCPSQ